MGNSKRSRPILIKSGIEGDLQHIPMKSRQSVESPLKVYIASKLENLKILCMCCDITILHKKRYQQIQEIHSIYYY